MKAEQQVGTQLNRQNSSNPSTEAYRLADKIAELEILDGNNITLKEPYINLMDQLEIDGIPKEKISTVGSKIIEQKKTKRLTGNAVTESEVYVVVHNRKRTRLHWSSLLSSKKWCKGKAKD